MEKFNKITITASVNPDTKKMLEELRLKTGMPYGILFDTLIKNYWNEIFKSETNVKE